MATAPPLKLGGPPPGSTPQGLSSIVRDQSAPTPSGGNGGLARVFYAIEQQLDSLASALPEDSESIDEIKTQLREILAKAISGGANFQGNNQSMGLNPTPDVY